MVLARCDLHISVKHLDERTQKFCRTPIGHSSKKHRIKDKFRYHFLFSSTASPFLIYVFLICFDANVQIPFYAAYIFGNAYFQNSSSEKLVCSAPSYSYKLISIYAEFMRNSFKIISFRY